MGDVLAEDLLVDPWADDPCRSEESSGGVAIELGTPATAIELVQIVGHEREEPEERVVGACVLDGTGSPRRERLDGHGVPEPAEGLDEPLERNRPRAAEVEDGRRLAVVAQRPPTAFLTFPVALASP